MEKLFLLEDDISLVDGLVYTLEKEGYLVQVVRTIKEAREQLKAGEPYALLILDVSLPDGSGFDVCKEVRASGNQTPILFLTAADEETHVIRGLDLGGDDYLSKPFRLGELCSRIRALIRRSSVRSQSEEKDILCSGSLKICLSESKVLKNGVSLSLTVMEYRLLCLFIKHQGQILTRKQILDVLWDGSGNYVDDNTLSVHIRRLREKIEENPSSPVHLLTVRGFGYQWKGEGRMP